MTDGFVPVPVVNIPPLTYQVIYKGQIVGQRMSRTEADAFAELWSKVWGPVKPIPELRFTCGKPR